MSDNNNNNNNGKKKVERRPEVPGDEFFKFEKDEEAVCVKHAMVQNKKGGGGFLSMGGLFTSKGGYSGTSLARYSVLLPDDPDFNTVSEIRRSAEGFRGVDPKMDRAIGSFVSMAIGDALGSPMEFRSVRYDDANPILCDMGDPKAGSNFGLRPGQWTDDASMGACIADSLLWNGGFDPYDLKTRFVSWWNFGYNNATRRADEPGHSVGLGGNISMSFSEFQSNGRVYTQEGDKNTSGNGSLMRNGAVAVYYHDDLATGLEVARKQSYLTHQGTEAAELCAALTHLVIYAINNPDKGKEEILKAIGTEFKTDCESVACLVRSEQEPGGDPNRNWQWMADEYRYAPKRAQMQPGYVGSYAMDALAMALHCVWKTSTYREALLMAANRCGDADSVCDITGQIAGAIYGYSAIPPNWIDTLGTWDGGEFTVKGWKMYKKIPVRYPIIVEVDEDEDASKPAAGGQS